jgi:uncharacterized protein (TIGR02453 family)
MIRKETLSFLSELKRNNHKVWFDQHKKEYQAARINFLDVTERLIGALSDFDPAIRSSELSAKQCIMRINRDIRFSKDKSPYKTNFFAFINREGKKSPFAGYYLNVQPGESFTGGGIYMPEPSVLAKLRQHIDQNFEDWMKIVNESSFLKAYPEGVKPSGQLSNPPRGYDKSNPAIEYLKFKGYFTQRFLKDHELTSTDFVDQLITGFRTAKPLVDFINTSIG